jgi:hypothetical protein
MKETLKQPFVQRAGLWRGIVRSNFAGTVKYNRRYSQAKAIHAAREVVAGRPPSYFSPALCGQDFYPMRRAKINPKGKISDVTCKKCSEILLKYKKVPDWII